MTLRMVFQRDDVQRIRVASSPDPMWETVLSLHRARDRHLAGWHADWRRQVTRRLACDESAGESLSMMFDLVPARGSFPDFLTPGEHVSAIDEGCEALASTSPNDLRTDLAAVFARHPAPRWVRDLAQGGQHDMRRVVSATRRIHDLLLGPSWHDVNTAVSADRAKRTCQLTTGGVDNLLSNLPGVRRWDGHTLELHYPATRTVRLAGRGLTLVPSLFCHHTPVTLIDQNRTPVLVYPATMHGHARVDDDPPSPLVALLGRTRAEYLHTVRTPHSTSQLAHRLGTSVGTASKQTTVLREAGLVRSVRHGGAVWHNLTALGTDLISAHITG